MKIIYKCFLFLLGSLIFLFGTLHVYAATGLTIQPIKLSHTIEPGQHVEGVIKLKNESDDAVNVLLEIEDFIPAEGSTNIKFIGRAEGASTVRDWISLKIPENQLLSKNQTQHIEYTITAPPDAEPGGHFGVIFFKATKPQNDGALNVGTRVGVLVFVKVPGPSLERGEILGFSAPQFLQHGPVEFAITFKNTGTVHFEPRGTITIRDMFGNVVGEVPVQGQAVLPTGVRELTAGWHVNGFLIGKYSAELELFDGEENRLTANKIIFYAFPLWSIFSYGFGIIIVFLILVYLKRKVKFSVSLKQ